MQECVFLLLHNFHNILHDFWKILHEYFSILHEYFPKLMEYFQKIVRGVSREVMGTREHWIAVPFAALKCSKCPMSDSPLPQCLLRMAPFSAPLASCQLEPYDLLKHVKCRRVLTFVRSRFNSLRHDDFRWNALYIPEAVLRNWHLTTDIYSDFNPYIYYNIYKI